MFSTRSSHPGVRHRAGASVWGVLLIILVACARQPAPRVHGVVMATCWVDASPVHTPADTAPGAPRFTLRGVLRTPRGALRPANVRVGIGGHGPAQVSGDAFIVDSIRAGRYYVFTTADGYQNSVETVTVPLPSDSALVISLAPAPPGYHCAGWVTVREGDPPPWWQFWRRPT